MNSTETLKKLASLSPKPSPSTENKSRKSRQRDPGIRDQGDMQAWFEKWAEKYCSEELEECETLYNGNIMYKLKGGCVFDRNHKEACIIIRTDGKICYHCFHDSCSDYHWRDFRELYDPEKDRRNTAWQGRKVVDNGQ